MDQWITGRIDSPVHIAPQAISPRCVFEERKTVGQVQIRNFHRFSQKWACYTKANIYPQCFYKCACVSTSTLEKFVLVSPVCLVRARRERQKKSPRFLCRFLQPSGAHTISADRRILCQYIRDIPFNAGRLFELPHLGVFTPTAPAPELGFTKEDPKLLLRVRAEERVTSAESLA